jgi:hypothetical protein
METTISATWTAEKAKQILDLVHADIREGLYTPLPGTTELASYGDLHDFVDANDYIGEVMGCDALEEEYAAVSDLLDLLLSEAPIKL